VSEEDLQWRVPEGQQDHQPYVAYGYPNLKSVRDLIYKKGHRKLNKQMIPLANNKVIEEGLAMHKSWGKATVNGVFLKVKQTTINMLRMVEPYVAYGYPNLKSFRVLI
jgi:hypothetical protein